MPLVLRLLVAEVTGRTRIEPVLETLGFRELVTDDTVTGEPAGLLGHESSFLWSSHAHLLSEAFIKQRESKKLLAH